MTNASAPAALAGPALLGLAAIPAVRRLIELALDEDLGRGDVTSAVTCGEGGAPVLAEMNARGPIVVFGLDIAAAVFGLVDPRITVERLVADGAHVDKGAVLLVARGPAAGVLAAERTALNFVQRLSGVATLSRRYADAVAGTRTRVVDTRKTTPGFRVLEKAAVLAGGCGNHRFDLGSGVLIKDNHIVACGSVTTAVERARKSAPHSLRVEVEVTNLAELDEALSAGADLISVGALTHSAAAVDIGLDFRTFSDAAGPM